MCWGKRQPGELSPAITWTDLSTHLLLGRATLQHQALVVHLAHRALFATDHLQHRVLVSDAGLLRHLLALGAVVDDALPAARQRLQEPPQHADVRLGARLQKIADLAGRQTRDEASDEALARAARLAAAI